jgi:hypothetical protein
MTTIQPPTCNALIEIKNFFESEGYRIESKKCLQTPTLKDVPNLYAHIDLKEESKLCKLAKAIISLVFLPLTWIFRAIQIILGRYILPAQSLSKKNITKDLPINIDMRVIKFSIDVHGSKVECAVVAQNANLESRRWILVSEGNGGSLQNRLDDIFSSKLNQNMMTPNHESDALVSLAEDLDANILLFNYPGVGLSEGFATKKKMCDAYKGALHFLEDKDRGLGATHILGYGYSIGGGVQSEALIDHEFDPNINYAFIKDRTFSNLSAVVDDLYFRPLGFMVKLFGWNFDTLKGSKALEKPEIILQSGVNDQISDDGVISKKVSLHHNIPESKNLNKKFFIKLSRQNAFLDHCDQIPDIKPIAETVKEIEGWRTQSLFTSIRA